MSNRRYIITGISRLSGRREQISGPMGRDEAMARLQREVDSRSRQKYPPYTRLRAEHYDAIQLTIPFDL